MTEEVKKRIYVVEDDSFLGKILLSNLSGSGFDVTLLTAGDEALNAIKEKVPDLIILDIFLPGLDGIELLKELRESADTNSTKVLVVSNTDQADSVSKVQSLGAKFVMKAATTPDEILEIVKKMLAE